MAKSTLAILSVALLTSPVVFAACDTSNIPGYYVDRYTDNQNGTITDNMTNLMWMKCEVDIPWDNQNKICFHDTQLQGSDATRQKFTWQEALAEAQSANNTAFAGKSNWRLPNIKELSSILALHCLSTSNFTALNTRYFDGSASFYWSSTPDVNEVETLGDDLPVNKAWMVSFKNAVGIGAGTSGISEELNVRLVRDVTP